MFVSKLMFIVTMCALVVIYIETRKISSRLKKLEEDSTRHNNIQSVILEQVDKISSNIGL